MKRANDENEIKMAFLKKQIQLTEQRLQNIFNDKSASPIPFEEASPLQKGLKTTQRCTSANTILNKNGSTGVKIEKTRSPKIITEHLKTQTKKSQSKCTKCKKLNPKKKKDGYDTIMKQMQLKKVRILDDLNKMEGVKSPKSVCKENKLKYQISVLKAEILTEQDKKKKLSSDLEKFQNRYKLNNFHPEKK